MIVLHLECDAPACGATYRLSVEPLTFPPMGTDWVAGLGPQLDLDVEIVLDGGWSARGGGQIRERMDLPIVLCPGHAGLHGGVQHTAERTAVPA